MVARHISMRGEAVDMERMRFANGDEVALGNASKNARGDQLGPDRRIQKTQEQIEAEWEAARARMAPPPQNVDIKSKDSVARALANLAPESKPALQADKDFDVPESVPNGTQRAASPRRRIIESN